MLHALSAINLVQIELNFFKKLIKRFSIFLSVLTFLRY